MGFKVQRNKIIINQTEIEFEFPIVQHIAIDSMLIVRLDLLDGIIPLEENVFGVSLIERKIKWQIERRKYPSRPSSIVRCMFVGMTYIENRLRLQNWCSTNLTVDPLTGNVLAEEETR